MVIISKVTNEIMISLRRQEASAGRHAFGGNKKMNQMRIGGMLFASLAGWMPTAHQKMK